MTITFSESRKFQPRHLNGVGNFGEESEFVQGLNAISPWNFLKNMFVDKPAAENAAQVAIAQAQAQQNVLEAQARSKTTRTLVMVGAGLAGLMLVGLMASRSGGSVAGYRRSRRTRSSRRSRSH